MIEVDGFDHEGLIRLWIGVGKLVNEGRNSTRLGSILGRIY